MTPVTGPAVLVGLLVGGAVAIAWPGRSLGSARLAALAPPRERAPGAPRVGPTAACALAAVTCVLLAPGLPGLAAALALVAVGPRWLSRLEPADLRRQREQLARDLPIAMDLLASCLAGGADPAGAAGAVGHAVGGPCGQRFLAVAGVLRTGSPPELAWAVLAGEPAASGVQDPLAPVARLLSRACLGGAPVAPAVTRLAADLRSARRGVAEQAARRVGVLAVAPLGLCFLPAFVLLGVVPVIVGLAGPVLQR